SYIIFGKPAGGTWGSVDATGRQVINVTNLSPNDGFIITGDAANDYAGTSVSKAGDINGDGIGDLIVGARFGDDGGADAGEAYVILGKSGG
ncbi:FG-GAP repeat protein, partial [Campylobacter jejuni]|uniref:integrin alpha n=1 Tax=Campylobacter jejuni TaxID=197 RepID=UPI001E52AA86